ncbi:hypothetical protein VTO42DRAFT_5827 [Malbranchea cinnamomea]
MKPCSIAFRASALFLVLFASATEAGHRHGKVHGPGNLGLKHHHRHETFHKSGEQIEKRSESCPFPDDGDLVPITPNEKNAGWAMSPDQACKPGSYCPYACPPGMVMAQWDPDATSYSYPQSMNGGLYCDEDGKISKPFPDKPYCVDASGPLVVKNKANGVVSFCQTVLPGNEAMLIPTRVTSSAKLAVPGPSYWCSTAAHYYINPPGVDTDTACAWGTKENPWGNWSPYVAGANTDDNGESFIKLGWNPIYLEPETPFRDESPSFGVKVECDGDCNGLPCEINPAKNNVNEVTGSSSNGAGGGNFCVVTASKGTTAKIVVFDVEGGGGSSPSSSTSAPSSSSSESPSSTPSSEPSASSTSAVSRPEGTASRSQSSNSPSSTSYDLRPPAMYEVPSSSVSKPSISSGLHMPSATSTSTIAPEPTSGTSSTISFSIIGLVSGVMMVSILLQF